MASSSLFEGRVGGARRSGLEGMFSDDLTKYNQKQNSFRVVPQTQNRRSTDVSNIIGNANNLRGNTNNTTNNPNGNTNKTTKNLNGYTNNTTNNVNANTNSTTNNLNGNTNNTMNNTTTATNANHGPGTTAKARVKPTRSGVGCAGGGMGPRPKSTLSLPDLDSGSKELVVAPSLQQSCRVFRSESTMPSLPLVARRIPLTCSEEDSESSVLDRRLEELILSGDITQLETFIQDQQAASGGAPVLVNTRLEGLSSPQGADVTDCTPLGLAIMKNDSRLVSTLIRLGADVTMAPCLHRDMTSGGCVQDDVMTPFHLAVMRFCTVDVIRALLDGGFSSNTKNNEQNNDTNNKIENKVELRNGNHNSDSDVDQRKMGEMGIRLIPPALFFPVLQYVAKCPDGKLARRILEAVGPDEKLAQYINVRGDLIHVGLSALHVACRDGTLESVKLLIEKGIDINARDKTRKTALMYAAKRGRADLTIKTLLSRNADVLAVDCSGRSALHYAVMNEQLTTSEILLKAGADPNVPDLSKSTPIDHILATIAKNSSASAGRAGASEVKILTLLIEHTRDRVVLSETCFLTACTSLIDRYSDVPDASTFTVLKRICADNPEHVKTLNPTTGETLLHFACRYSYASSIVQWLVSSYFSTCDLNLPGDEGYPPLILAVRAGATDSAAILLRAGANVNVTSANEPVWSGLWLALCRGNAELVKELITAGADPKGEMALRYLRIAGARQGQQAVTADDPLMLLAANNSGKVNAFEFSLHKNDMVIAHKLMTTLKTSPYVLPENHEKKRLALELLAKCVRDTAKGDKDDKLEEEIKNWITTGKLNTH